MGSKMTSEGCEDPPSYSAERHILLRQGDLVAFRVVSDGANGRRRLSHCQASSNVIAELGIPWIVTAVWQPGLGRSWVFLLLYGATWWNKVHAFKLRSQIHRASLDNLFLVATFDDH